MATPAFAGNAVLQFGRESVWGTEVNATKRMPVTLLDFQVDAQKIRSKSMNDNRVIAAIYAGTVIAKAVIEVELQYINDGNATDPNGYLMLMDACFGSDVFGSEGFASSGGPTYTHTYTLDHPIANSLTLELVDGEPGAVADKCVLLTGAKVANWELSVGLGDEGIARLRVTLIGKVMTTNHAITGGPLTSQAFDPVLGSTVVFTAPLSETATWQSFKLSVDTGLLEEGSLGSVYLREPVFSRFAKSEIELVGDFDAYTSMAALLAHTASTANPANFRFVKDATAEWSFKVALGTGYVVGHQHQVTGEGIVRQTIRYEVVTDVGLVLDLTCTQPATEG